MLHLSDPGRPCVPLLVDATSSGKTHVARVAGVIERKTVIIIIPLLPLSAGQMVKFSCGNQRYVTIEAHHMDELYREFYTKYRKFLCRIRSIKRNTTSTMFCLCSPQFFVEHPDFCKTCVSAASECVL